MKAAVMTIKVAILVAMTSTINPALASVQQNSMAIQQEDASPSGLIIVKMLPPEQQSEVLQHETQTTPSKKITDRRHPEYVRCRIEPVASSILKKRRVCMTNREWKLAIRLGNKYATEFVADNQPGFFVP
ncbi:hypothetical protein GCM10009096_33390 [Parasphingorhabdus litoris]|uniref:UrcA family protein n=1 Tax=Parasphingorhabdus litoris TaxID=394733 RepID=A0ABP3KVK0_9SPHN|nr:hypothetical protein [Parasphingorhabdus litoris]